MPYLCIQFADVANSSCGRRDGLETHGIMISTPTRMENRSPIHMPKLPGSVFAEPGDKPDAPRNGKMAWLLGPLDRWLSAPGSSDPLHVSNRTLGQKLLIWTGVAAA